MERLLFKTSFTFASLLLPMFLGAIAIHETRPLGHGTEMLDPSEFPPVTPPYIDYSFILPPWDTTSEKLRLANLELQRHVLAGP